MRVLIICNGLQYQKRSLPNSDFEGLKNLFLFGKICTLICARSSVVERVTDNDEVLGSIPSARTIIKSRVTRDFIMVGLFDIILNTFFIIFEEGYGSLCYV